MDLRRIALATWFKNLWIVWKVSMVRLGSIFTRIGHFPPTDVDLIWREDQDFLASYSKRERV